MTGAREFTDTALFVITRRGTEGVDLTKWAYDQNGNQITNGRKYSTITKDEESLLEKIKEKFDKVIVVFNVANIMESGFVDDDKIDAALMLYTPGNHATPALGEILNGTVTPSGHLVDTVAYDLSTAPSYVNAGATGTVTTADPYSTRNQDYAEDIYIGYYWYETADAEGFWDSDFAKQKWGISNGYKDVVQYPFGYGLSYADFEWEVLETSYTNGANLTSDEEISFKVEVTNKSTAFSGKDVVQLYYTPPYYSGKIEKPVVKLAAFAKTGLLGPGKSEVLTLTLKVRDLACYDCYDRNNNGFMGYEVEGGNYVLFFRSDAHTLKTLKNGTSEYAYTVPKSDSNNTGFLYRKNEEGTYDVVNRFTNYTAPSGASSTVVEPTLSDETKPYSCDGSDSKQNVVYTTRNNFTSTFPVTKNGRATDATFYNNSYKVGTPKVNSSDQMPATGVNNGLTIQDMIETDSGGTKTLVDIDDEKWDRLISQMSLSDLKAICAGGNGAFGSVAISSIGLPRLLHSDGPSGFNTNVTEGDTSAPSTNFPSATLLASTWDWKLAYNYGTAIGSEAFACGINGWYGPGANTHRSPLGGRNFEYYSEDPYIAGIMCAYQVYGAKEEGLFAWIKHIVANDSDTGRNGMYHWLTEQSLREIYLKPFELSVRIGGASGMMSSVDRIGSVRCSGSYALLTEVLRNEWGFKGAVITDYYQGGTVNDIDEQTRAGCDLCLTPQVVSYDDGASATAVIALQKSAKNIVYQYMDSVYTKATAQGLDLSTVISTHSDVFPWWKIVLIVFDVAVVAVLAVFVLRVAKKANRIREAIADGDIVEPLKTEKKADIKGFGKRFLEWWDDFLFEYVEDGRPDPKEQHEDTDEKE